MRICLFAAIAVAAVAFSVNARAATITGAGGTAIYPVLSKWADQYAKETGNDEVCGRLMTTPTRMVCAMPPAAHADLVSPSA
jgi:hypothetical protein